MEAILEAFELGTLWDEYGLVGDIVVRLNFSLPRHLNSASFLFCTCSILVLTLQLIVHQITDIEKNWFSDSRSRSSQYTAENQPEIRALRAPYSLTNRVFTGILIEVESSQLRSVHKGSVLRSMHSRLPLLRSLRVKLIMNSLQRLGGQSALL